MDEVTATLSRWRLRVQELEFDVVHRAGMKHQVTDALSQLGKSLEDRTDLKDEVRVIFLEATTVPVATVIVCTICDGANEFTAGLSEILTICIYM